MKKNIIVAAIILLTNLYSNAQVNPFNDAETKFSIPTNTLTRNLFGYMHESSITEKKEYYLEKSKRQKSTAWVLLGGGSALIGIGLLIGNRNNSSFEEAGIGIIVGSAGVAACIGSIPLFIAARKNKTKATLSIGLQRTAPSVGKNISSISLKIPFG